MATIVDKCPDTDNGLDNVADLLSDDFPRGIVTDGSAAVVAARTAMTEFRGGRRSFNVGDDLDGPDAAESVKPVRPPVARTCHAVGAPVLAQATGQNATTAEPLERFSRTNVDPGKDAPALATGSSGSGKGIDITPGGVALPPDGGDGGKDGADDAATGSLAEAQEQTHTYFQPIIEEIQAKAAEVWSNGKTPRVFTERIADPRDPTGGDSLVVRLVPEGMETLWATEVRRHEALVRASTIDSNQAHVNLDRLVVHDEAMRCMILRPAPGKSISKLTAHEKREITRESLEDLLKGLEVVIAHGAVARHQSGSEVVWDSATRRFGIRHYVPIEHTPASRSSLLHARVAAFDEVILRLRRPTDKNQLAVAASTKFRWLSEAVVRNHLMYEAPRIIIPAEELDIQAIEFLYDRLSPVKTPAKKAVYRGLHASRLHDRALNESSGTVDERLRTLSSANQAYHDMVYEDRTSPASEATTLSVRTAPSGISMLFFGEYVLPARLALACMPISEARIRGEQLDSQARATADRNARSTTYKNLAVVLQEMIPDDLMPSVANEDTLAKAYSNLSEVIGPAALARQNEEVDTGVALSVSAALRPQGGPDAGVPYTSGSGRRELGIDWKIRAGYGKGSGPRADNVPVGSACLYEAHPYRMANPPELGQDAQYIQARRALLYAAKLLRDEGLGRQLTTDEFKYLNRVQMRIWARIVEIASADDRVPDLEQRARFK